MRRILISVVASRVSGCRTTLALISFGSLIFQLSTTAAAQADDFVVFKRCYLDISVSPAQFRPFHPSRKNLTGRDSAFSIRPSSILYISQPEGHIAGIACVRIATASGAAFVQGTVEEVGERLRGN